MRRQAVTAGRVTRVAPATPLLRILNVGNFTTPIVDGVRVGQPAAIPVGPAGAVCANIYVFDDIQELEECCSCPLSADKVLTLSTIADLTSNPLFKNAKMSLGTIKILGCNDTPICGGAFPASTGDCVGAHGLKAWLSHAEKIVTNLPPSFGFITSTSVDELASVPIDAVEGTNVVTECNFAVKQGSGAGICDCGAGGDGIVAAPGSQSSSQQSDSVSPRPFSSIP